MDRTPRLHALDKNAALITSGEIETTPDGKKLTKGVIVMKSRFSQVKIKPDEAKELYKNNLAVEPFIKINLFTEFVKSNSIHSICIQRKARVIAGLGIKAIATIPERKYRQILRKEKRGEEVEPEALKEARAKLKQAQQESEFLNDWLSTAGDDLPLREVLERGWRDLETYGWMGFEVVRSTNERTNARKPSYFVHIPAHLIRRTRDRERFIYLKSPNKKVWFKTFGNEKHLNVETGEWSEKPLPDEKEANELLFWYQYSPFDPYYGVPDWYAALMEILGANEARDFMFYYFARRATPTYAVIMEGGEIWTPAILTAIRNFFRRDLMGDYHATLALQVPEGGKITFERVTDEPRWIILIQEYLNSLRNTIVSAHGLSPAVVGIIETAHLGSGTESSQLEMFKMIEVKPKQETLENLLNNLIVRKGLGLETQMLKLDEVDIFDEQAEVQAVGMLYANPNRPTITLNEARKRLRYEPCDEEWADEILFVGPQGIVPLSQLEVQKPEEGQSQPWSFGWEEPSGDLVGEDYGGEELGGNGSGARTGRVSPTRGGQVGVEGQGAPGVR